MENFDRENTGNSSNLSIFSPVKILRRMVLKNPEILMYLTNCHTYG